MHFARWIIIVCMVLMIACDQAAPATSDLPPENPNPTPNPTPTETINTAKLVGTPFENMTTGDDIPFYFFQCNQYKTETITGFPIKIFTAFFTPSEEG